MYTRPPTAKAQANRRMSRDKESFTGKFQLGNATKTMFESEYDHRLDLQGLRRGFLAKEAAMAVRESRPPTATTPALEPILTI